MHVPGSEDVSSWRLLALAPVIGVEECDGAIVSDVGGVAFFVQNCDGPCIEANWQLGCSANGTIHGS